MNEGNRSRWDFLQNITIAVLTVSAVLLFAQTQIVNLGASSSFLRVFFNTEAQSAAAPSRQTAGLSGAPVRVAAASVYGRYGDVDMTTDDEEFLPLGQLLEQALGSVPALTAASADAFRAALDQTSVYYDYLSPLPLSILADLSQSALADSRASARRLVLAEEGNSVALYLLDSGNRCYRGETTLSPEDLNAVVSQYELGNAAFAFDEAVENADKLDPYSLLPSGDPELPRLSVSVPLSDSAALLSALRFNPNTQNRYREADATEVITESDGRTLRLSPDGTVSYQGGSSNALSIQISGEAPTLSEAAGEVRLLLQELFAAAGDAQLYLETIQQTGSVTMLRFGCHVGGVPIRFTDGGCAATVTLSGSAVSFLELRLRQYTVTEAMSLLLPLRQTLAIAAQGAELSIGYADNGGDTVQAAWLAD